MQTYIIAYDLHEGADYEPLVAAIKRFGTWARMTESTWAIVSDESAESVRTLLSPLLSSKDRIIVIRSGHEAAWWNVMCRSEWLKEYI